MQELVNLLQARQIAQNACTTPEIKSMIDNLILKQIYAMSGKTATLHVINQEK